MDDRTLLKLSETDLQDVKSPWGIVQIGILEDEPKVQLYFNADDKYDETITDDSYTWFNWGFIYVDYEEIDLDEILRTIAVAVDRALLDAEMAQENGRQAQRRIVAALLEKHLSIDTSALNIES